MKTKILKLGLLAVLFSSASAQALVITPGAGDGSALASSIAGTGISVSNVTYTGANNASGLFSDGTSSGIGIESGVILTSGSAASAVGPNSSSGTSTNNGVGGSAALTALSGGTTFDASILSFDFIFDSGIGGDLFVNFVFASEEYNEYVNSNFNDVFAFYLNGVNIALLPDASPVSIDTVNLGSNSGLYNDNDNGINDLEYDGFTDVFYLSALGLGAGTHTMSFEIADSGDGVLDSGVFVQAKSFSNQPVPEPLGIILLGLGLIGFTIRRKIK